MLLSTTSKCMSHCRKCISLKPSASSWFVSVAPHRALALKSVYSSSFSCAISATIFHNNVLGGIDSASGYDKSFSTQRKTFATTTRRRRVRGSRVPMQSSSNETNDDNEKSKNTFSGKQTLSSRHFQSLATELLDKVENSLTKLKDCNDGLEILRFQPTSPPTQQTFEDEVDDDNDGESSIKYHGGQLCIKVTAAGDLYWGGGTYLLTVHSDNKNITLQSPLSGNYTYVFDVKTREWIGSEDGHSMLGMFTRDWIRQCQGVPDF